MSVDGREGEGRMRSVLRLRPLFGVVAALALGLAAMAPGAAWAQLEVDVNQGVVQPMPIAVPAFNSSAGVGGDISRVIQANLERSGLFRPLSQDSFIERNVDVNVEPRFDDWKIIGAQALVNGQVTVDGDGRLRVDFRL